MAETLAAIGLASAIIQFIDFGSKVVRRLRELEDLASETPSFLNNVRNRLHLMLDLVKKIMLQMDAGLVGEKSKEAMYPVVQDCISQAQELDRLFKKILPGTNDNYWARGKKAVYSVLSDSEVERIDASLRKNFELLMQAGTFLALNRASEHKSVSFAPTFTLSHNVHITSAQPESHGQLLPWEELGREPSNPTRLFMVPFPRDHSFLGRQDTLGTLSTTFQKQRRAALSGLGGIGKSQVAIEYCYVFKEEHPNAHVFWLYGADPLHFSQGYQEIARKAVLPGWDDQKMDKLELTREWLQSEKSAEWLMVVDNADDATMFHSQRPSDSQMTANLNSSNHYFPHCDHGKILITTRDKRLGERFSQRQGHIQIPLLNPKESRYLLKSKITDENWSDEDAERLVEYLSYLPLAITQAAAFVSENSITITEYLETLLSDETDTKELLSEELEDSRRDWNSENSVMRTWKLSFEQISKESPRAAELLSLLAVLDYHGAPRSLLRQENETETAFRVALGILQAFSLLTVTRGSNAICKMHSLVALATQRWLEVRGTIAFWQSQALKILANRFPGPGQQTYAQFANMLSLVPHTELVLSCRFGNPEDSLLRARLLISTALFDLSRAKYSEALRKSEQSLKIREGLLPNDHPEVLESVQTLGESRLHHAEYAAAKDMLERAIGGRERCLGPLHIDTLESLSDMTITLLELNDLEAAEKTGKKALIGRKEVLGNDHADYLVSLNIMAILYQMKGDYDAALSTTYEVLNGRERLLGLDCPDTLMTLNNLARLKYQTGDYDAARHIFDKVLTGEEKLLARNGYDVQVTLSNKADVLVAEGRLQEAEHVLRSVLDMREDTLGSSHPSTLFTVDALADVLERQKDSQGATKLRARLAESREWPAQVGALLRVGLLFD